MYASGSGNEGADTGSGTRDRCARFERNDRSSWSSPLIVAIAALSITCGGDKPELATGTIAGHVLLAGGAPVAGASVTVWMVDDDGTRRADAYGSGTTDSDGAFALDIGVARDSVVVEAAGGTSVEVATDEAITLDPDQVLSAVVTGVHADDDVTGIEVTPVTTLGAALGAQRLARGDKEATYPAAIDRAHALLAAHFGAEPLRTVPLDVTDAASNGTTLTPEARYGLVLAAWSELGHQIADASLLSANAINTVTVTEVWVADLTSDEALFDGVGPDGALSLGSCESCEPSNELCTGVCVAGANSPRARLARALRWFVGQSGKNATGLDIHDIDDFAGAIAGDPEVELFGDAEAEPLDVIAPEITWVTPQAGNVLDHEVAVEVTASDLGDVASLEVSIAGGDALTDEDPDPARFYLAALDTEALAEGALTLRAVAADADGNSAQSEIGVTVNNLGLGTISGVVVKGPIDGATVSAYRFTGGIKGAILGSAETDADGLYQLTLDEGWSGPILIEAGAGGSYREEAAPVDVGLDVGDLMRTIVLGYEDGDNLNNIVVTPLTSLATAYAEYLLVGGAMDDDALATAWADATAAMQAHTGVINITTLRPEALAPGNTFSNSVKYSLVLAGLSQMAYGAADDGGGDAGTFGSVMNGLSVWRALEADLADGCWDGRAGTTQLYFGTAPLSSATPRIELADAIVAYLGGAENPTPFSGPSDVLPLLDALASSGPAEGTATCAAGELFPDPGTLYDQNPPIVVWDAPTPAAGSLVRGTIVVTARATDDLAAKPSVHFTAPGSLVGVDTDGDFTDSDCTANIDTNALGDIDLLIEAEAEDYSTNTAAIQRSFTIDNTKPVIWVEGPDDGGWYKTAQAIQFGQTDDHPGTTTAMLDSAPFTSGTTVPATPNDAHTLVVSATDAAGNSATPVNRTFTIDNTPPELTLSGSVPAYVRGTLTLTAIADDNLKNLGSITDVDIQVVATGTTATITPTAGPTMSTLGDGRQQVVVSFATSDAGDGTLTVEFDVTDRAGNPATQKVVTTTVDNTPPDVTLDAIGEVGTPTEDWTSDSTPTLQGTVSEGGSPVTVAVILDGGVPQPATVAAGIWSYTPASPLGDTNHTIQVTASDQAGNPATPVGGSFGVDTTAPSIDVSTTQVYKETSDSITYAVMTAAPSHDHRDESSGGEQKTALGLDQTQTDHTCAAHVYKYTHLLYGNLPSGTTENVPNPLAWSFKPSDGAGVGIDPTSVEYQVHLENDSWPTDWISAGTPDAGGTYTVDLYRGDLPALVTEEAVFEIRFRASDYLEHPAANYQDRCWTHHPLAAPLEVGAGAAVSTADDSLMNPLADLTLGTDSSSANNPDDDDIEIAKLLNSTSSGAAIMKVTIRNGTPDPVYVSLPSPTGPSSPFYERDYVTTSALVSTAGSSKPCGCTSGGANCNPTPMPTSVPEDGPLTNTTSSNLHLAVRVFTEDLLGNLSQVSPNGGRYQFLGRYGLTYPKKYIVVVATTGLPDLRTGMGTVGAATLTWSSGSRLITGSLGSTFKWCSASTDVTNPDICPGSGNKLRTCTQEQTWQTFTALTKARIVFSSGEPLKVSPQVAPTSAMTSRSWPAEIADLPSLPSYSWSTAETGLPTCTPSASNCPPAP